MFHVNELESGSPLQVQHGCSIPELKLLQRFLHIGAAPIVIIKLIYFQATSERQCRSKRRNRTRTKNSCYLRFFDIQIPVSLFLSLSLSLSLYIYIYIYIYWIKDHYHLSSNLDVGISEGCFIFDLLHYIWRSFGSFSLPCAQK